MKKLNYPFDAEEIFKKKRSIKRELMNGDREYLIKKVALLGGMTTSGIKDMLELFLMNNGIRSFFYESEYNRYYEEGIFENPQLEAFCPDIIYICTCNRNIHNFPELTDSRDVVNKKLEENYNRFEAVWKSLGKRYNCPIIQNNFEYPAYRLLGNRDAWDYRGKTNFITELNRKIYNYAESNDNFYICDINYISASYGLEKWSKPYYWYMYKYALEISAIPYLSFNVANIIKSVFGRNKKAFNLDLDNTLWGGIVGDDGADNIEIGQETAVAQAYSEFQQYLKSYKELGVLLTVNSKNDMENAVSGLKRPDSILIEEDFACIKANWNPKSVNLLETAREMNLLPESYVFVDDNPAERAIVEAQINGVAVPEMTTPENYINIIDKSGFFEVTLLSEDDLKRTQMYMDNKKRVSFMENTLDYDAYLKSLDMHAEIKAFAPEYLSRITQLTNKSNQFNLTTKRYTQSEIEEISENKEYITLYGKLSDRFGDNGVVSVIIGKISEPTILNLELWLMSCRVLKRDMEYAMMDKLVQVATSRGIKKIIGYYFPTEKNAMVKNLYGSLGFECIETNENGNTVWEYIIEDNYSMKQSVIVIRER